MKSVSNGFIICFLETTFSDIYRLTFSEFFYITCSSNRSFTVPVFLTPLKILTKTETCTTFVLETVPSQGPSCMLLLAVGWTAAIVYLQVSAANCYKGYKWSRMLPLVLSQEPDDQSIWRLFYATFTGCRFDSRSPLSVCMAWLHSTFRCIASQRQLSSTVDFDLLTPPDWLFHAPEQTGDHSFAVQGYRVWNSLPAELHTLDISLATFRNRLKTFLFYL